MVKPNCCGYDNLRFHTLKAPAEHRGSLLLAVQLSLQHRDDEIQRLSAKLDVDRAADVATLSLRNETNEAIILSLNQQVGQYNFLMK